MIQIVNYNCDGICVEKLCMKKYTNFEIMNINGLDVLISLCDKHKAEWEVNGDDRN